MPVLESCAALKEAGFQATGHYVIDPDGVGTGVQEFQVFCDMTSHPSSALTVVGHDSEGHIRVAPCEGPGCYSRKIKYAAELIQLNVLRLFRTPVNNMSSWTVATFASYKPAGAGGHRGMGRKCSTGEVQPPIVDAVLVELQNLVLLQAYSAIVTAMTMSGEWMKGSCKINYHCPSKQYTLVILRMHHWRWPFIP